jgi:TM2 domain-containing membrane protein YozV
VLSLIIPGAGQIYSGALGQGIFWMALTVVVWFAVVWFNVGGLTGALCHVIAAITAWLYARRSEGKPGRGSLESLMQIEENFDILKKKKG